MHATSGPLNLLFFVTCGPDCVHTRLRFLFSFPSNVNAISLEVEKKRDPLLEAKGLNFVHQQRESASAPVRTAP